MSEQSIDEQLDYLATELLGRPWLSTNSSDGPVAAHNRYADRQRLLTGNGMLEIIEAMRTSGWHVSLGLEQHGEFCVHFVHFGYYDGDPIIDSEIIYSEALPEGVARAAYAALKEE